MSTQIKKNGNWVTVAGGTRMWVGTKAALQAALDAGELVDGTAVMVTDDYEENTIKQAKFTTTTNSTGGFVFPAEYINKVILSAKRVDPDQDDTIMILGNGYCRVATMPDYEPRTNASITVRIAYIDATV